MGHPPLGARHNKFNFRQDLPEAGTASGYLGGFGGVLSRRLRASDN